LSDVHRVEASSQDNAFDPRIVANAIIKQCAFQGTPATHIALQKLLYFAHGLFLVRHREPLVSGFFEAWTYGPVHPAVYAAFKDFGAKAITGVARRKDLRTGKLHDLPDLTSQDACRVINKTIAAYGELSAGQLVRLSHAKGGPWHIVCEKAQKTGALGLRISNDLISERFQYHKLSSCNLNDVGELSEDTPIANYGFG
jgi:uncharacterized phage-associated protein